jgi:hypothetical protein
MQRAPGLSDSSQRPEVPAGDEDRPARPVVSRGWAVGAWAAGGAALFALFLRISLAGAPSSDPANNALQAWDMLHGHLLLHGWIVGDATFYTFELPLMALAEIFFGLHTIVVHVTEALVYLIITAGCVAIAVTGSRGMSRAARAGVVAAVLAAPAVVYPDMWVPLGFPDHTGSTVFLLAACLLIDRPGRYRGGSSPPERAFRWFTAPLLCVILCAGQISDVTVRYVAVTAVIVACGYQVLAARSIRTGDAANLVAAAVSLPLATVVRAVMRHFGSYRMREPKTSIVPAGEWAHNATYTWHSVRLLFGTLTEPGAPPAGKTAIFGFACLIIAVAGALRVIWRWRTARRAEQALLVAIVVNLGAYTVSGLPGPRTPHDIVVVLPASAILGARALVPARIAARPALAASAAAAAVVAALLPLSLAAAARPPQVSPLSGLTTWLAQHGLRYGLGGYWDGSAVTLLSGDQVQVRTVRVKQGQLTLFPWETNTGWFNPAQHYANFVIIDPTGNDLGPNAEPFFGKPASEHRVGAWEVLIYDKNVLRDVRTPRTLPPLS